MVPELALPVLVVLPEMVPVLPEVPPILEELLPVAGPWSLSLLIPEVDDLEEFSFLFFSELSPALLRLSAREALSDELAFTSFEF